MDMTLGECERWGLGFDETKKKNEEEETPGSGSVPRPVGFPGFLLGPRLWAPALVRFIVLRPRAFNARMIYTLNSKFAVRAGFQSYAMCFCIELAM